MSLSTAVQIAEMPNARDLFDKLTHNIATSAPAEEPELGPAKPSRAERLARGSVSSGRILAIAAAGQWDTDRYASPSEARFAVIRSAYLAGMSVLEINTKMHNGTWRGLAGLYGRYAKPFEALRRDYDKAQREGRDNTESCVRENHTSRLKTQGGREVLVSGEFEFLKLWRNCVHAVERNLGSGTPGLQRRLVLRALGEAAGKSGDRTVAFGVRSLSLATGLDATTVGRHLRALRSAEDALIVHRAPAQGIAADSYELVIPKRLLDSAAAIRYRKGRLHALRPVFRVLGVAAAFVLEQLEMGPCGVKDICEATGLSRSTVHEALGTLAAHRLAENAAGTWRPLPHANLGRLAEQLGAMVAFATTAARYKYERSVWQAWLASRQAPAFAPGPSDDYPFENFEPLLSADEYSPLEHGFP